MPRNTHHIHPHDATLTPTTDLTTHPDNPRQGDIGAITESIKRHGWYGTLIAQRSTGHVLAGNHRLQAAIALGITHVPVTYLDVTDEQARRILIADNRTSDLATYDDEQLSSILQELEYDGGLDGTGYDGDDLDDIIRTMGHVKPIEFPTLRDGDKEPYQQMTFVLHDDQAAIIKDAITRALSEVHDTSINTNSNGNALAHIARSYLQHGDG